LYLRIVIDDFNREALGIEVDFSLAAEHAVRTLNQIVDWRGKPTSIRCDNGPEYPPKKNGNTRPTGAMFPRGWADAVGAPG